MKNPKKAPIEEFKDAYDKIDKKAFLDDVLKRAPLLAPVINQIKKTDARKSGKKDFMVKDLLSGNDKAATDLIDRNLYGAMKIAYNYATEHNLPLEDVYSSAVIGIAEGIESYKGDPHDGGRRKFATNIGANVTQYINTGIHSSVRHYIMQKIVLKELSGLSKHGVHNVYNIYKIINKYDGNVRGAMDELKQYFKDKNIVCARGYLTPETLDILDMFANESYVDASDAESEIGMPDMASEKDSLIFQIKKSLDILTEKERDILKMFYGLWEDNLGYEYTLDEIAIKFDLTRERTRQIKDKAIRRLKQTGDTMHLKVFLGANTR